MLDETLCDAINDNNISYHKWLNNGRPEACSYLNDSNRYLIEAYKKAYPNAVGYAYHRGIVTLEAPYTNFCIDRILHTDDDNIIRMLNDRTKTIQEIDEILQKLKAPYIIWS